MPRSIAHPRTVIITGASAGIGRAIAARFARAGDRVGLIARDRESLEATRNQLEACGARIAIAPADVADADAVFAAADSLERELGKVDVWINDAMETVFSPVAEITPQEFRRVTEVTYLGFVHGTMAALRSMRPRNRGRIIQIGSALAYRGIPLQAAYCGAKHAIRGFNDSLRAELIHERANISVAIVELPAVNTPQFDWARLHIANTPRPMGQPVQPEVAADAVFRAANSAWREYWLGAQTVLTIIANTIVPAFLDRYLARTAVSGQQTGMPATRDRRDNLETSVTPLHRTRGSFSAQSSTTAFAIPGEVARIATVAAGAYLLFSLGRLVGRRRR
jgi:short-subunit dehydrogenase